MSGKSKDNQTGKQASLTDFFSETIGTLGSYVYNKNNSRTMLAIHAIGLMEAGIQVLAPIIVAQWVQDRISNDRPASFDSTSLSVGLSGLVLSLTLPRIRNSLINSVQRNVQQEITLDMVAKVYDGELNESVGKPTGECAAIVSKNYGSVQNVMPIFVSDLLPTVIETFGISAVLSTKFGMIGSVPALVLMPYLLGAVAGEIYSLLLKIQNQNTMVEGFGKLLEVVNNYVIAHQYGNLDLEINKLETSLTKLNKSFTSINHAEQNVAVTLALVAKLGLIGTAAYTYFKPPTPDFWVNDFMLFGYYILRSTALAENLPPKINALFTGLIDTKMIVDFFKKESPISDPENPSKLNVNQAPSIEFQNVSFNYGEGKPGLSNINFTVKEGQKIAIMGPTGSGKSTLLKLLQRFYPFDGQIRINDVDITKIKKDELRSYLSVVSQDTNLVNDTLYNNIAYGDRHASEEEVFAAARYAELNLDRGRFFADAKGANFSGGEKQRTNIARSLLKPSSFVFLLDEPTSALDQQTAKEVHEVLDQLTKNVTTIMVTHDPYAVMYTDLIVYMEQGTILEQGTFQELMETKGAFYKQFVIQCEKLGISPDDIKPTRKIEAEGSSEFLAWRTARRSTAPQPLMFSKPASNTNAHEPSKDLNTSFNS